MRKIVLERKQFINQLSGLKSDNVMIADVAINRKILIEALKLQTQDNTDFITLTYGKAAWSDKTEHGYVKVDNEPCIQFNCNHTTMRFLNRPAKSRNYSEPKQLSFMDKPVISGTKIDVQALLDNINRVSPCIMHDRYNSRPQLQSIYFELSLDTIRLVACDGLRLAVSEFSNSGITNDIYLLTDIDVSRLVTYLKANKDTDVYFVSDPESAIFNSQNETLKLSKFEGNFPEYSKLIPDNTFKIVFDAATMNKACKALRKIVKQNSDMVNLKADAYSKTITLKTHLEETGDTETSLPADIDLDFEINLNISHLIDYLKHSKGQVTMLFNTASTPIILKDSDGNFEVQMPMIKK